MSIDQSNSEVNRWIRSNTQCFSLCGLQQNSLWCAGADTPMVLASAQKVYTLYAFIHAFKEDFDILKAKVYIHELNKYYMSGTDNGAHERSLAADGFRASDINKKIPIDRILVYMMRYSANAAADFLTEKTISKLSSSVGNSEGLVVPPLISTQIIQSEKRGKGVWYKNTTKNLAEMVRLLDAELLQNGLSAVSYLPIISKQNGILRGKKGNAPGHRAGAVVFIQKNHPPIYGAYSFHVPEDDGFSERIEAKLINMITNGPK